MRLDRSHSSQTVSICSSALSSSYRQNATDSRYSYGWHRAEILAALVNGVFLLALCFSISLEALERFFNTPEISNPRLVVVVGCLGLASNLVGLFLFHEHSHSHSHSHSHGEQSKVGSTNHSAHASISSSATATPALSRTDSSSSDNFALSGHPVATRASLVQGSLSRSSSARPILISISLYLVAHDMASRARSPSPPRVASRHLSHDEHAQAQTEETPLLSGEPALEPAGHAHARAHDHGHAGSMNMRALVLHVLGDALGNVGVIATGLVIWQTSWSFKYYFDPVISLVITAIIFSSALPLVRSASFVLLQGVPSTISLDQVRSAILAVDGVLSLHELHIWQLSESKNIASVHVLASRDIDFMPIAANIRKALHDHGIHSCTIQPEYYRSGPPEDLLKASADASCLVLCPQTRTPPPVEV
ncbi:cation efflux protein [Mycena sp. CBHHK59/15]|nr:cation efflux protein [Mycena sp. CBHHK59/15]